MSRRLATTLALTSMLGGACIDSQDPTIRDAGATETTTTVVPRTTTTPPSTTTTTSLGQEARRVAEELAEAERSIRDPATTTDALRVHALTQQQLYRRLASDVPLAEAVVARLPEDLRAIATHNIEAGRSLRALVPNPKTELPRWRIVPPAPADELLAHYREAEAAFAVPWQYLAAIHLVETRMGRIIGLSSAGAQGPMQFMPRTWEAYGAGGDVTDDRDAILGAGRYLAANGAPGDMANALWNYNHHDGYVAAIEHYAQVLAADPAAYRGYHGWQVIYLTVDGDVLLEEGWVHPDGEVAP